MNKPNLTAVMLALSLLTAPPVMAETEAEQMAKNLCAGCHGPTGVSTNPLWPNLAGQKSGYLTKTLIDYREGARLDPSMNGLIKPLTDAQIQALAEYYAKLPAGG